MRNLLLILIFVFALAGAARAQQASAVEQAFNQGTQAARHGEYESALKNYQIALTLAGNEKTSSDYLVRIYYNMGVCLFHLQRNVEAVQQLNEAIKLSQRSYQKAFYALGMTQKELKNRRAAEIAFRDALRLKKDDGEAWFDLGLLLLEEEDFEEAALAFQKAIKYRSVSTADAHNNLGVIYALRGDISTAENEFKTALHKSGGKSAEARENLQICELYKQGLKGLELLAKLQPIGRRGN